MPAKPAAKSRSGCPVSISLELLGDRWSLLVIRDLMVRGLDPFKDFEQSGEGIATNILADRLRSLTKAGIITAEHDPVDARRIHYRLTRKGIDLAPVLYELLLWGARYEVTAAPPGFAAKLQNQRDAMLGEVRRRWETHDRTPMLPKFKRGEGK